MQETDLQQTNFPRLADVDIMQLFRTIIYGINPCHAE